MTGLIIDLFAGGGGASTGIEAATGRIVDYAINHDEVALETHRRNHPRTQHLEADIWEVKPRELLRAQFGRFAADYDLSAAETQEDAVRLIGNSVCPEVAEAIVAANAPSAARRAA